MIIHDVVVQKIHEAGFAAGQIPAAADLYADLGFDSLSFVTLLVDLEKTFSIKIPLARMDECLRLDRLITLIETQMEEPDDD